MHQGMEFRSSNHISALLIRRCLLIDNNIFFPEGIKLAEDAAFCMLLTAKVPAYCCNKVVSYYVRRENSATTSMWKPKDFTWQDIFTKIMPRLVQFRPQAKELFENMRMYMTYRHILRCIRAGYIKEARYFIDEYKFDMEKFVASSAKINDRLKCKGILMMKCSDTLLRFLCKI